MKIFKFGGASVKNAKAVKNLPNILKLYPNDDLVIVISAMDKMTNAFEKVVDAYFNASEELEIKLNIVKSFHYNLCAELFVNSTDCRNQINAILKNLEYKLSQKSSENYDYEYDQIVAYGELLSTAICSQYLNSVNIENTRIDARELIRTDDTYREAKVNWEKTESLCLQKWNEILAGLSERKIMITQGFIAHTAERNTSTLGREGSDFTAGIIAYCLNAESVTIWKDVPGMLNADPKYFKDAVILEQISYKEAIELSYYGASVIHPKTIKPLQNKQIPLYVKSFLNAGTSGTLINSNTRNDSLVPSYIFKTNQILISITTRDFSFIEEENLSKIFNFFAKHRVRINLMQNSAINFSVCVDFNENAITNLIKDLRIDFEILYNRNCELVTIRHYNNEIINQLLQGKKVLLNQQSRNTARMVLQDA